MSLNLINDFIDCIKCCMDCREFDPVFVVILISFSNFDCKMIVVFKYSTGLLNLRGSDIDFNPIFFAYIIVTMDDMT